MLENYVLRPVLTCLLRLFFRVEVRGLEHYHAAGERVLILANHQSYLDPMLLAVFLPQKPAFAINVFQAEKWFLRWVPRLFTLYRLDPSKPLSMKSLIGDLKKGAKVVIFPEGRITTSGGIMKVYDGTRLIIEKTGATVLSVHVSGADYSKVSRLGRKLRQKWFPKLCLTILPPVQFAPPATIPANAIYDLMTESAFAATDIRRPVLEAVLDAYAWHGGKHTVVDDITHTPMGYRTLLTKAFILSEKLSGIVRHPESATHRYTALMLPSSGAAAAAFLALHMRAEVPCMLNFSAGEANILHACDIAGAETVITSRAFVEKAKLENIVSALQARHHVIFLEDIKPLVTLSDKLAGLWKACFASWTLAPVLARTKPDDPAVVLYTSGSEGAPKGVALSHANLLANIAQASARLDITTADKLFNAMPVFHSFGLTVGMLLPLVRGIATFMYPSPLHYRVIPELVYDTDATIMLGTDTFYNGYAHYAHPYDFWRIRLAVAGAEKLKDSTRALYADIFRVHIAEGYGVTEASPVLSVNTPLSHKTGSVGRLLPGIEARIEPVEGIATGGRLFVRGPNIMLGYLKADQPGIIQPHADFYDTGDIVSIDDEGYVFIQGRAKRFAKIAGEMVSLMAVEELAAGLYPEAAHAAVAVADARKGEQIILYTESRELTREQLAQHGRALGVAEIALPKQVMHLQEIPRLGGGKIDYITLAKMNAE